MLFLCYLTVTAFCLSTTFGIDITKPDGTLDVGSLTNVLLQMQLTIKSLQTSVTSQETKYASILSTVIATLKTKENDMINVKKDIDQLQHGQQLIQDDLHEFSANMTILVSETAHLTSEVQTCENNVQHIKSDVTQVKTDVGQASKDITSLKTEVNLQKSSLVAYQNRLQSMTLAQGSLTRELQKKQSLIAQNTVNIATTRQQCTAAVNSVKTTLGTLGTSVAFQAKYTGRAPFLGHRVVFDTVSLNTGHGYNAQTGLFTAPVAGKYVFWFNLEQQAPCGLYVGSQKVVELGLGGTAVLSLSARQTVSIQQDPGHTKLTRLLTSFGGALL